MSEQSGLPDPQAPIPGQSWMGKLNPERTQVIESIRVYDSSKQTFIDQGYEDFSLHTDEIIGQGHAWDPATDTPILLVYDDNSPNLEGNVWFGFPPKPVDEFWALHRRAQIAYGVQQALAADPPGTEAQGTLDGLDAEARLLTSSRMLGLREVINQNRLIDPDDRDGAFMEAAEQLVTIPHEVDGLPLMSVTWQDAALPFHQRIPTGGVFFHIYTLWQAQ